MKNKCSGCVYVGSKGRGSPCKDCIKKHSEKYSARYWRRDYYKTNEDVAKIRARQRGIGVNKKGFYRYKGHNEDVDYSRREQKKYKLPKNKTLGKKSEYVEPQYYFRCPKCKKLNQITRGYVKHKLHSNICQCDIREREQEGDV